MKGEEGKIKKHRKRKGRVNWLKRSLAVCLAAATLMTGVGLESVFADEAVSTGKIETQQSAQTEVQTQAETGEADENTAAANAADPADHNNAPESVTTGEEADKAEAADEGQTTDVVNTDEVSEGQAPSGQSADNKQNATGTKVETNTEETVQKPTGTQAEESVGDTPKAITLPVLEKALLAAQNATDAPEITVHQYANESNTINLREGELETNLPKFKGGSLAEGDTEEIPDYVPDADEPARIFKQAAFVYKNAEDNMVWLTGLYPHKNDTTGKYDWYYTTKKTDENNPSGDPNDPLEEVEVGYLLPENTEIRFYYELTGETLYTVETSGVAGSFNLSLTGGENQNGTFKAKAGAKIIATLNVANTIWWAECLLKGASTEYGKWGFFRDDIQDNKQPSAYRDPSYTHGKKIDDKGNYQFEFTMPKENLSLTMTSHQWEGADAISWFGLWAMEREREASPEYGATRIYTYSKTSSSNTTPDVTELKYSDTSPTNGFGTWYLGGEPLMTYEAYYKKLSWPETSYRKMLAGNLPGSTNGLPNVGPGVEGLKGLWSTQVDQAGTSKNIPVGEFVPGGTVVFGLEASRALQDTGSSSGKYLWRNVPATLSLDIYRDEDFSGGNFDRYTLIMPKKAGTSVSEEIPGGGKITIECRTVHDENATDLWGKRLDAGYGKPTMMSALNKPQWYTYKITVSGIISNFKIVYNMYHTSQSNHFINALDGTVEGSDVSTVSNRKDPSKVKGDFIYYAKGRTYNPDGTAVDNPGTIGYYPLREGLKIETAERADEAGYNKNVNWILLGAQVQEGYSKPEITMEKGNASQAGFSVEEQNRLADGRYVYKVALTGTQKNDWENPTGRLSMVSEPIQFSVKYGTNENGIFKEHTTPDYTLQYDENENYIILPYLPNGVTSLKGYNVEIWTTGDNVEKVANLKYKDIYPDSAETIWMPATVMNVRDIYKYLTTHNINGTVDDNGALKAGVTQYDIRLIPEIAGDGDAAWLVDGIGYNTYQQTGWFDDWNKDPDKGVTEDFAGKYFGDKETRYIDGYINSTVVFSNYPEAFLDPDTQERYVLQRDVSVTSGIASQAKTVLGYFYYINQAELIGIGTPDYLTDNALANDPAAKSQMDRLRQWAFDNKQNKYTGVKGRTDNVFKLPDGVVMPQEINTSSGIMKWAGWKFGKLEDNGTLSKIYNYKVPDNVKEVNLYDLYQQEGGKEVWEGIFGTGIGTQRVKGHGIVLVPTYSGAKIEPAGDTQRTVETYTGGNADMDINNGSFTLSADFSFIGNKENLKQEGVGFAIIKSQTGGTTQVVGSGMLQGDEIKYLQGSYISNGQLTMDIKDIIIEDGTLSLSCHVVSIDQGGTPTIRYENDNDATYAIYAWSSGNSITIPSKDDIDVSNGIDGDEMMWIVNTGSNIPGDTNTVKVLPKAVSTIEEQQVPGGEAIQQIESPAPIVTNAETDFDVTGSFQADPWYPVDLQIGDSAASEAKVHIALYKKNPYSNPTDWHSWAFDGDLTSGAGVADSTEKKTNEGRIAFGGDGEATVTFPIFNQINPTNGNPTVSWQWDDRAKYCIVAWNESNKDLAGDNPTFTENNLCPGGAQSDEAPSVTSEIQLQWQESNYYVYIPANVILTEDEANVSGGSEGYAGAAATIRYKNPSSGNPAEGNNEKDQPEVEVKVEADKAMTEEATGNKTMTMGIYGTDGTKRQITQESPDPIAGTTGNYAWVGVLKNAGDSTETTADTKESVPTGKSISYQINAKTNNGDARGTSYTGTVEYILTLRDYVRPTS